MQTNNFPKEDPDTKEDPDNMGCVSSFATRMKCVIPNNLSTTTRMQSRSLAIQGIPKTKSMLRSF